MIWCISTINENVNLYNLAWYDKMGTYNFYDAPKYVDVIFIVNIVHVLSWAILFQSGFSWLRSERLPLVSLLWLLSFGSWPRCEQTNVSKIVSFATESTLFLPKARAVFVFVNGITEVMIRLLRSSGLNLNFRYSPDMQHKLKCNTRSQNSLTPQFSAHWHHVEVYRIIKVFVGRQ